MEPGRHNKSLQENFAAIILCFACGVVLALSLLKGQAIDGVSIAFVSEEHYLIGYEYYSTGQLSAFGQPSIFRAPGYPAFVALALNARDLLTSALEQLNLSNHSLIFEDHYWVISIQLLLLLAGAFIFYKSLRLWIPKTPAMVLLTAYIINPFSHSAVRTLSYEILDFFFITVVLFLCGLCIQRDFRLWHYIVWELCLPWQHWCVRFPHFSPVGVHDPLSS